jgi:hypothetical protein
VQEVVEPEVGDPYYTNGKPPSTLQLLQHARHFCAHRLPNPCSFDSQSQELTVCFACCAGCCCATVGLVTLEDIIEDILQTEIEDEIDEQV